MRKTVVMALAFSGMVFLCPAQQKTFKETVNKELSFSGPLSENTLVLQNVFGPVSVEGYSGKVVKLTVDKTVYADNAEDLELGKKELTIKVVEQANRIIVHPDAPYIEYDEKGLRFSWCNNHEEPDYEHRLSFKVKVPKGINLQVSTVNDGDIAISDTQSDFIKVNNVNGGIDLTNVVGKTDLHCINGAVNVSYASNPDEASQYYSLNGDINVVYQNPLSADVTFKSMNGELFTDFSIEKQYVRTNKEQNRKGRAKFKYESTPVVQIGKGGIDLAFETLNGNVFIKKM